MWASLNFPSQITGFCGSVYSSCSDPAVGPRLRAGLERLVPRGVVHAVAGSLHRLRHHVPRRPGAGRGRDPSQRGARVPGREPARATPEAVLSVAALGLVGPGRRGVRRDRHRGLPPRRELGDDGHAPRRSAGRVRRDALLVAVVDRGGRLVVVGLLAAPSRPAHRHVRGRHRLGADAVRPPRLHPRLVGSRSRTPGRPTTSRRPRTCCATSGSARSTTRRSGRSAIASASTTSWSRSTTRTPTRPGPTRQRFLAERLSSLSDDEQRRVRYENAAALFRHPLPPGGSAR